MIFDNPKQNGTTVFSERYRKQETYNVAKKPLLMIHLLKQIPIAEELDRSDMSR